MSKSTLDVLARKYNTDKKIPDGKPTVFGSPGLGYSKYYYKELKSRKIKSMIEIGVAFGSSIKMWDEFFNNKCKIIGIDKFENSFKRSELENNNVRILIGDQGDRNFLEQNLSENRYDLVIDDGSHKYNDQMASFLQIFPYVSYGGLYVVEDLHISTPFARLLKNYHEFQPSITSMIKNIRFYEDKIAFIEKVSY